MITVLEGVGGTEVFAEYLAQIENPQHCARAEQVLGWVGQTFPVLAPRVAWNQPMFTDHGTFIIGFSISAKHLAISPEQMGMERFTQEIAQAGYAQSKMLFRIPWAKEVNYQLLHHIITFNCTEKAHCKTFWRNKA